LLAAKLNDCRTCHLAVAGDSDDPFAQEKPHNRFGARLKAVRDDLRKAGRPYDLAARLGAVAAEDADGDGVPNEAELLLGHNPGEAADVPTAAELADLPRRQEEWARLRDAYPWRPFEPVRRPPVPSDPAIATGARNPIDAFIAAEHQGRGLSPRPEAPRAILLRRVYLDLTGLPPSRDDLHAFLADPDPGAYERVVDRLLASPQYGERWARHWMDVWRYSDWAGFGEELRESQRHIWHWRDWIVESLNADKGYDQMVREMLAGDELAPTDPGTLRATGFLARNWYKFSRNSWLNNTVEHTSKAFLGVTLNCARCHDHMYDPIGQKEYYAFRAIFEPHQVRTDRVPGHPDLKGDGLPRAYDGDLNAPTYLFVRGDETQAEKSHPVPPGVPQAIHGPPFEVQTVTLPKLAFSPDKRDFVIVESLAAARKAAHDARSALALARQRAARLSLSALMQPLPGAIIRLGSERAVLDDLDVHRLSVPAADLVEAALEAVLRVERLEDEGNKDTPEWRTAALTAGTLQRVLAVETARRDLVRAEATRRAATPKTVAEADKALTAARAALAKAEAEAKEPATARYTPRPVATYPATSTGRRLALARWITDRQNPLAARVAVNHIWLRHFGHALVPTVFDFGRNGQPPSHPALLDWLAAELMDSGWSMKRLHRLIVTSATYRQDSAYDASAAARDPDNRFLWRFAPRRLEAEAVRDSVLFVAGSLDPARGGPDLDHAQGLTVPRRSLYFRHAYEKQMLFLSLFDAANVTECYRRTTSVVPQQALALANSPLVIGQARLLARKLTKDVGPMPTPGADLAFVRAAFEQVLGRLPTVAEEAECVQFLTEQARRLAEAKGLAPLGGPEAGTVPPDANPHLRAREGLVQVLMNHHEFVTIR
jgi:hypothetical protein